MLSMQKSDAMVGAVAILFAAIMSVTFVTVFSDLGNKPGRLDPSEVGTAAISKLHPDAKALLAMVGGSVVALADATDPRGSRSGGAGSPPETSGTTPSRTVAGQGGDAAAAERADPHDATHFSSMPAPPASPLVASVDSGTSDRLIVMPGGFGYYLTPGLVWPGGDMSGAGSTPSPGSDDGTSGWLLDGADGQNGSPVPPSLDNFGDGSGNGGVSPVIPPDSQGSDGDPDHGNGGAMSPVPVPEPPQVPLMLLGLLGMGGLLCLRRWRRRP